MKNARTFVPSDQPPPPQPKNATKSKGPNMSKDLNTNTKDLQMTLPSLTPMWQINTLSSTLKEQKKTLDPSSIHPNVYPWHLPIKTSTSKSTQSLPLSSRSWSRLLEPCWESGWSSPEMLPNFQAILYHIRRTTQKNVGTRNSPHSVFRTSFWTSLNLRLKITSEDKSWMACHQASYP